MYNIHYIPTQYPDIFGVNISGKKKCDSCRVCQVIPGQLVPERQAWFLRSRLVVDFTKIRPQDRFRKITHSASQSLGISTAIASVCEVPQCSACDLWCWGNRGASQISNVYLWISTTFATESLWYLQFYDIYNFATEYLCNPYDIYNCLWQLWHLQHFPGFADALARTR